MAAMQYRLLGGLEVTHDGRPVEIGSPKQRAVLALLVLAGGRVVSTDQLIDTVWGAQPPAAATTSLHTYISNLRRALEPERKPRDAPTRLLTRAPGYLLVAGRDEVDWFRLEDLLAEGRSLLAAGRAGEAAERLTRGVGHRAGRRRCSTSTTAPPPPRSASRWVTRRQEVHDELLGARLASGEHRAVLRDLEEAVAEQPYDEGLRAKLVIALYRSGRQRDALQALQDARRVLADEVGRGARARAAAAGGGRARPGQRSRLGGARSAPTRRTGVGPGAGRRRDAGRRRCRRWRAADDRAGVRRAPQRARRAHDVWPAACAAATAGPPSSPASRASARPASSTSWPRRPRPRAWWWPGPAARRTARRRRSGRWASTASSSSPAGRCPAEQLMELGRLMMQTRRGDPSAERFAIHAASGHGAVGRRPPAAHHPRRRPVGRHRHAAPHRLRRRRAAVDARAAGADGALERARAVGRPARLPERDGPGAGLAAHRPPRPRRCRRSSSGWPSRRCSSRRPPPPPSCTTAPPATRCSSASWSRCMASETDLAHAPARARAVPDAVQDVIRRRIGRLPPVTQQLLVTAAVVGRQFALDVLADVAGAELGQRARRPRPGLRRRRAGGGSGRRGPGAVLPRPVRRDAGRRAEPGPPGPPARRRGGGGRAAAGRLPRRPPHDARLPRRVRRGDGHGREGLRLRRGRRQAGHRPGGRRGGGPAVGAGAGRPRAGAARATGRPASTPSWRWAPPATGPAT